ncbi:MAG TPA: serine/threonine-protein kinase [Longimicrobium sp.]|jgi:serine/threonine-protein kinase|uniref:serine/threonine-protein kinase n=1 Tax=Longimicrobium sp. TaxID=2029185 RepID=UPI002ED8945D
MAGLEGLLTGHTLVKRYIIEQVIGRGGFAVVYQALDKRLNRPVAVKVITLNAADAGLRDQMRERLQKEARAAASLPHHPNLVTVHDVGTDPELGLDFLVMEMLWGQNLAQYFKHHGRPNLHDGLRILRDAAEGLAIGHRAGLIHRDIKPANIFLAEPAADDEPTRVCLLDYGIAQAIEDDQTVTRGMATPLSPGYASPEQLAGARDLSAATDVFSLGVVAYQLLTGERPFAEKPGEAPTAWTVRRPLRALNSRVPAAVEAVVMKALSESPADRYPDAAAFGDALDAAQRPDDVTAVAPAPPIPVAVPVADAAPPAAAAPPSTVVPVAEPAPAPPADDVTALAPAPPPIRAEAPARPAPAAVSHAPRAMPPLRPADKPRKGGAGVLVGVLLALLLGAGAMWAMFGRGGGDDEKQTAERPARDTTATATRPADTLPAGATTMTVDSGAVAMPPVSTGEPSTAQPETGVSGSAASAVTGGGTPSAQPQPQPNAPASRPAPAPAPREPAQQPRPQPQQPAPQPQPRPAPPAQQPRPTPPAQQPRPAPPAQQPRPRPTPPVQREPEPTPPPSEPEPQPQPPVVLPPASPPVYTPIPPPAPPRPAPVDTIFFPATPPEGTRGG